MKISLTIFSLTLCWTAMTTYSAKSSFFEMEDIEYCRDNISALCPDRPSAHIYYEDPEDCGAFCECSNGKAILFHCDAGVLWDEDLKVCNYADKVDCGDRPQPPPRIDSTFESTEGGLESTTVKASKETTLGTAPPLNFCPKEVSAMCNEVDPGTHVHFANPDNCGSFCECSSGIAYLIKCQDGTLWDDKNDICNFSENVDCGDRPQPPSK